MALHFSSEERGISLEMSLEGDPSLRLKTGCVQDDAAATFDFDSARRSSRKGTVTELFGLRVGPLGAKRSSIPIGILPDQA